MHSRCSSDLSKEGQLGGHFFSDLCELTEDKHFSRFVESRRKTAITMLG